MKTDPVLRDRARAMRRQMTEAEARLWRIIRNRQIGGIKFSRQVPIGPYIADFAARMPRLVIELDGDTHTDQARDARRTVQIEQQGYRVIRFSNQDVTTNPEGVASVILGDGAAA